MPLDADEVRLRHMLEAAKDAVRFASGSSRPDLDHNRMIDLNILWDTVELDLPPLIAVLETHIAGRN